MATQQSQVIMRPQGIAVHAQSQEKERFAHPHRVMLGLYVGAFLGMLSETSMNIALPDLCDTFGITTGIAQWMVVGYMLAIGIVLPTMYAAIMRVFPPQKIGAANGVAGLVIMFAPVIGPTLAGLIIGAFSWRAIFMLFAVVAVVAIACTAATFVTPIETTRPKVDALSVLASVIGFGCLVAGVSLVADMGFSPLVVALLVIGVLVVACYAYRQLHIANPVLDLRALGIASFRTPALMVTCSFACTLAIMYLAPQELQRGLGLNTSVAGMLMLAGGVVNAVCSFLTGRWYDRVGARPLVSAGAVIGIVGSLLFLAIGATTAPVFFILAHVVFMIGIPLMQQSAQSAALKGLPRELAADGSTILNTMQQVFGAIGTSIATCLLGMGSGASEAEGFVAGSRYGYVFGLVLIVVVLAFSFFLKEARMPRARIRRGRHGETSRLTM